MNGYKGDYINDIAAGLKEEHGDRFLRQADEITKICPRMRMRAATKKSLSMPLLREPRSVE